MFASFGHTQRARDRDDIAIRFDLFVFFAPAALPNAFSTSRNTFRLFGFLYKSMFTEQNYDALREILLFFRCNTSLKMVEISDARKRIPEKATMIDVYVLVIMPFFPKIKKTI